MRGKRTKWIRKVVLSKCPAVTKMLQDRYRKGIADKLTNAQVISYCKKAWTRNLPGTKSWYINIESAKRGDA